MSEFTIALGMIAPVYNLGLVIIALYLFYVMFTTPLKNRKVYLAPWKFLFLALFVFIVEELLTILRQAQLIDIPRNINGFFELAIISLFIYTLLLQKQKVK